MPSRAHAFLPRRNLHLSPPFHLRQKLPPPNPTHGDYYSLLLSSPLPTASQSPKRSTTATLPASTIASEQYPNPKTALPSHKPLPDPKIVFGSRLAGPAERREKVLKAAEMAERPQEPDNCCMSGCVHCVWDIYREEVEEWAARRREKEKEGVMRAADSGRGRRKRGFKEGGWDDLGSMGDGFEGVDLRQEGLFEEVPVGIREFMATEKRLRERREGLK